MKVRLRQGACGTVTGHESVGSGGRLMPWLSRRPPAAQQVVQALEVLAQALAADVLEHPDRADGVERPVGDVPVVLQADLDPILQAGLLHPQRAELGLALGDRDAHGLDAVVACGVHHQAAPATAHVEQPHPRLGARASGRSARAWHPGRRRARRRGPPRARTSRSSSGRARSGRSRWRRRSGGRWPRRRACGSGGSRGAGPPLEAAASAWRRPGRWPSPARRSPWGRSERGVGEQRSTWRRGRPGSRARRPRRRGPGRARRGR